MMAWRFFLVVFFYASPPFKTSVYCASFFLYVRIISKDVVEGKCICTKGDERSVFGNLIDPLEHLRLTPLPALMHHMIFERLFYKFFHGVMLCSVYTVHVCFLEEYSLKCRRLLMNERADAL